MIWKDVLFENPSSRAQQCAQTSFLFQNPRSKARQWMSPDFCPFLTSLDIFEDLKIFNQTINKKVCRFSIKQDHRRWRYHRRLWIIKVHQITGIIVYLESSNSFGSFTSILSFEMTLRPSDHERQYQLVLSRNSSIDYMATTCPSRRSAALNLPWQLG